MPPVVAGYLKLPMLLSYSILLLIEDLIQVYGWPTVMNIRHEIQITYLIEGEKPTGWSHGVSNSHHQFYQEIQV